MSWLKKVGKSKPGHASVAVPSLPPLNARLGDWMGELREESNFSEEFIDQLTLPGQVSALAYEPGIGLLAVGTSQGTVHLYGAPPVRVTIHIRPALRVKHLLFKSDTYLLVCIDEKDNLSVYDLSRQDPHTATMRGGAKRPPTSTASGRTNLGQLADTPLRVGTHSARNSVLCAELTMSHNMLFLGLADGTVEAYDLERFSSTGYRIPNLWWNEEEAMRRNGDAGAPSRLHVPLIIDMKTHPRDVNLLLLCYEGGAVLYSLQDKQALMAFRLRLLPGAPGAQPDAPLETIWSERLCPATSISWAPNGEQFAMGHEDGCISFWSIKDEDKPLQVRTIDEADIDRPIAPEDLKTRCCVGPREPIFKLAWSAFPGPGWYEAATSAWNSSSQTNEDAQQTQNAETGSEGTVLTVMGGTAVRQNSACLNVFHFPAFSSTSTWASNTPEARNKARVAQQQALIPRHVSQYRASSTIEDFLLLPRLSPHYNGTYDPYAILILVGPDDSLPAVAAQTTHRGLETYSFPPKPASAASYFRLHLPWPLSLVGRGTLLGAEIHTVPLSVYRRLTSEAAASSQGAIHPDCPMGGFATPNMSGGVTQGHALAIARAGQPRFLLTWHLDGSVRVHDISPHLLLLGKEDPQRGTILERPFPSALPHLTVNVRDFVLHPSAIGSPALEPLQRFPMRMEIQKVVPAWDAAELLIQMTSGHALHLAYAPAALSSDPASTLAEAAQAMALHHTPSANSAPLPEFTPLEATASTHTAGFKPHVMLHLLPTPPTCTALSNAGLCAVASGGLLVVADARSQDIIVRAGFGANDFMSHQLGDREKRIVSNESSGEIVSLQFAVCRIAEDPMLAPRLIVVRTTGFTTIWTFEQGSLGDWFGFRSASVALDTKGAILATCVLDPSGAAAQCNADDIQRAKIEQDNVESLSSLGGSRFHLLLVVSEHRAVMHDQVTGPRIGVSDLPDKAYGAQVVSRPQGRTLLTVSHSSISALSLPRLDLLHRIQRHVPSSQEVVAAQSSASIESQGDFIELTDGQQLRFWSAFGSQPHGQIPTMCIFTPRPLPYAPGVGAAGYLASLGEWFGSSVASNLAPGAQIDAAVAGTRRAPLPKLPPRVQYAPETLVGQPVAKTAAPAVNAEPDPALSGPARESWLASYQRSFTNFASGSARSQAQRNVQLLHKRDELLTNLGDGLSDLERSAKDFLKQYASPSNDQNTELSTKGSRQGQIRQIRRLV